MRCVGPVTVRIASCCVMAVMQGKIDVSVVNINFSVCLQFLPILYISPQWVQVLCFCSEVSLS